VWENDIGDGKSLVRDDATVVDFQKYQTNMKLYIRKQLRTQIHQEELKIRYINCILQLTNILKTQILKTMKLYITKQLYFGTQIYTQNIQSITI
jgi:hypothetical protein